MGGVERRGAEGTEIERRRRENRGAEGDKGVGCGEGVSVSPWGVGSGEGALPLPRKVLDFLYQNGDFCAFWVALFTVYLKLFYMQNGTFGLPKLKVTAAFALAKIERETEKGKAKQK